MTSEKARSFKGRYVLNDSVLKVRIRLARLEEGAVHTRFGEGKEEGMSML